MISHDEIASRFNDLFLASHNTKLVGAADEPRYQFNPEGLSIVYYREDFSASALHEAAHWCLAGAARRKQNDYGYWYEPERDSQQQKRFELVERRPQALERIFSKAAGLPFRLSVDNLALPNHDLCEFRSMVQEATLVFLRRGIPARAQAFANALSGGETDYTQESHYQGFS